MPNQTVVYALACLRELAKFPGELIEVAKVAQRQGVPLAYCQKVLHALAQAGIVTSVRGRGFALDRSIETISIAEIMTALEKKADTEASEPNAIGTALKEKFIQHLKALAVADILAAVL